MQHSDEFPTAAYFGDAHTTRHLSREQTGSRGNLPIYSARLLTWEREMATGAA